MFSKVGQQLTSTGNKQTNKQTNKKNMVVALFVDFRHFIVAKLIWEVQD